MRIDDIELKLLKAFRATAQKLHFGQAAADLHTTQPSLSRQIRQLEAILGFPLFERHTRSVALLPQGKILLAHTDRIFDQVAVAAHKARSAAEGRAGLLRIGIVGTPAMACLVDPLRSFRATYPNYEITLEESSSTELAEKVADQRLECAAFLHSASHPDLAQTTIGRDRLAFAVSQDHPLSRQPEIAFDELLGEVLILFPPERNPSFYQSIAASVPRFDQARTLEASSRPVAILMAGAGFGIAVIAMSMAAQCPPNVACIPCANPTLDSLIILAWPKNRTNPLQGFLH